MARSTKSSADDVQTYDALNCTHTSLRRAGRQLTQIYDDALAPAGLSSAQSLLVAQLDALGGRPGQEGPPLVALAKRLGLQISALSHALRPLVRDGLVVLQVDGADRRIKRATLTDLGLEQTLKMYVLWQQTNQRIEQVLGEGSAEKLRLLANQVASPDFAIQLEKSA